MVDDRPEDSGPPGDAGRPRREPPTIDLEATDVSTTPKETAEAKVEPGPAEAASPEHVASASKPVSPWAIAWISGAVAAALVIAVGWALGWPTVQAPPPAVQLNAGAIDDLTTRIAGLESKASKPATPAADPAPAARMEAIEKSVAALRSELAATRAQADKLASAINDVKAAPRDASAASPDLSAVDQRIAQIERVTKAQETEIAAIKTAEAKPVESKPADDVALRRVVAASLLDVSVRRRSLRGAACRRQGAVAGCRCAEAVGSFRFVRCAECAGAVPRARRHRAETVAAGCRE